MPGSSFTGLIFGENPRNKRLCQRPDHETEMKGMMVDTPMFRADAWRDRRRRNRANQAVTGLKKQTPHLAMRGW